MTKHQSETTTGQRHGEGSNGIAEAVREQFESSREQARDAAEAARHEVADTARRASDQSAQFVRDNPALAMTGAVGLGILLGLALKGRS